jgi:hypothetical protein
VLTSVRRFLRSGATSVRGSTTADRVARAGLAARGLFYVVLAYLAARIALLPGSSGRQANTHGALELISRSVPGKVAIAVAAAGFCGYAVVRLASAWQDREAPTLRRWTTAGQGIVYLALTYVPISFLVGDHATGSERQQHAEAARLLGFAGGRELVVAIGVVVVGSSCWQIRTAYTEDYADGLQLAGAGRLMTLLVRVAGKVGIAARALVFFPIGIFLIVAAVQYDPDHAKGIDGELLELSGHSWGDAVILLSAAGLLVFALYSFLEARYRDVDAAR